MSEAIHKLAAIQSLKLSDARSLPAPLSTGIDALDANFGGGLPRGALTEIFGEPAQGGWWFGLRTLANVRDKMCALVEPAATFFPPGAAYLGVNLRRLIVIRENNRKRALWALERITHEKNIGATIAAIPGLTDTELRRLQLASEHSGQACILMRAPGELSRASWGALRLKLRAEPSDAGRCIVVETLRARGGAMPRPIRIELENDSLVVRTSALLPHREVGAFRAASAG
ncbi:MAG: hypothetical protein IT462_01075 [Planctomycetes bacterium]|nr:hypothetical protein [Planctomycetota bacterium]